MSLSNEQICIIFSFVKIDLLILHIKIKYMSGIQSGLDLLKGHNGPGLQYQNFTLVGTDCALLSDDILFQDST